MGVRLAEKTYEEAQALLANYHRTKGPIALVNIATDFGDPDNFFIFAEEGAKIVGMLKCKVLNGMILALPVSVAEVEYQESGVFGGMILMALNHAKERGVLQSYVVVGEEGETMRTALHECGFKVARVNDDSKSVEGLLFGRKGKSYLMVKDLQDQKTIFDTIKSKAKEFHDACHGMSVYTNQAEYKSPSQENEDHGDS